jgi:hypothetical protein
MHWKDFGSGTDYSVVSAVGALRLPGECRQNEGSGFAPDVPTAKQRWLTLAPLHCGLPYKAIIMKEFQIERAQRAFPRSD